MGVNNRGAERKDRQIEEKGIRKGKCRGLEEETEGGTKREGVKRCETEGVRRPKQDEAFFLLYPRIRRLDGRCFYRFPVSGLMDGSTTKASIFICHLVRPRR